MPDPAVTIRAATSADIPAAARVYVLAEDDLLRREHDRPSGLDSPAAALDEAAAQDDFRLLLHGAPSQVQVAIGGAGGDEVLGVAAFWISESWWFLAYLFVRPDVQGQGIGRALLERCHGVGREAGCTVFSLFASEDPRAVYRYLRLGLTPHPPIIDLRADPAALTLPAPPWDDGLDSLPLTQHEPDLTARLNTLGDLDKAVRGTRRAADLDRWLQDGASGAILNRRDTGAPAGYYLVHAPESARTARLGPVVALDTERFPAVLARALATVAPLARPGLPWRVTLPGQNTAALTPLLAAGFRPKGVSIYLSTAPIGQWDRYLPRDEDFM